MPILTIREEELTDQGFVATLNFDSGNSYEITVSDPFTPRQEGELEWYFEEWLVFPILETAKAERAAISVQSYGKQLFEQVFKSNFDAYGEYRDLRRQLSQVEFVIESESPEFQGFHWEALQDPDLPRPFSVDCIISRKRRGATVVPAKIASSPTLNLLVVIARPDEETDVNYRTISRPLVELVSNSDIPVKIDILRPGTYEALTKHLDEKGEGYYHVIHFDVHGGLMRYEQYEREVHRDPFRYQRGYGLDDLEEYQGVKAFLFLEGDEKGKATPVEATELADLLTGKNMAIASPKLAPCTSWDLLRKRRGNGSRQSNTTSKLWISTLNMAIASPKLAPCTV